MNSLSLSSKDYKILLLIIAILFIYNITKSYIAFNAFKNEEVFSSNFEVMNIYKKEHFNVIKVKNDNFYFFTSLPKNVQVKKLDNVELAIITRNINFIKFLKGFYAKTIYFENIKVSNTLRQNLYKKINSSHKKDEVKEFFSALFLAIPVSKLYRNIYSNWSISHLIAISGFHLVVILFIFYHLIYFPYSYMHKKIFIYRNRKFDILFCSLIFAFLYLLLIDKAPSFLRSFVMFVLAIFLLRSNIKIISYKTLLISLLFIIALFPSYFFSLSLWFSIIAVFYIFLYIQYFKNLPKFFSIFFFNFWIFFVFNPIVHYFFYNTSQAQLFSPLITLFFTIFYPVELFLHFTKFANIFDFLIEYFLNYKINVFQASTPLWFFVSFIVLSLFSTISKKSFIALNIATIGFNLFIFL